MNTNYLFLSVTTLFLGSCTILQPTTTTPKQASTVVKEYPKFTIVDQFTKLNPGMTYTEVVAILGCEAYDVYSINHSENQTVYTWKYKKINRLETPENEKLRSGSNTGTEVLCCEEQAYLTFVNGKFQSLITDASKFGYSKSADNKEEPKTETPSSPSSSGSTTKPITIKNPLKKN